ncbi:12677_t:CDS:2, partial [Acaulospora colombiana]
LQFHTHFEASMESDGRPEVIRTDVVPSKLAMPTRCLGMMRSSFQPCSTTPEFSLSKPGFIQRFPAPLQRRYLLDTTTGDTSWMCCKKPIRLSISNKCLSILTVDMASSLHSHNRLQGLGVNAEVGLTIQSAQTTDPNRYWLDWAYCLPKRADLNLVKALSPEWTTAYNKAKTAVAKLSLSEKLLQVFNGKGDIASEIPLQFLRSTFRDYAFKTGHWVRDQLPSSVRGFIYASFSSSDDLTRGINTAATWNRSLMRQRGAALGAEFRGKGIHVALGPAMNIARVPHAGRNVRNSINQVHGLSES